MTQSPWSAADQLKRYGVEEIAMSTFEWVVAVWMVGVLAYIAYMMATRGLKGSLFGVRILASGDSATQWHHRGVTHTVRLYKLEDDDLYGLELGRWAGPLGETDYVVITRDALGQLGDHISSFLEATDGKGTVLARGSAAHEVR